MPKGSCPALGVHGLLPCPHSLEEVGDNNSSTLELQLCMANGLFCQNYSEEHFVKQFCFASYELQDTQNLGFLFHINFTFNFFKHYHTLAINFRDCIADY